MLYTLINPSDPIHFEAPDQQLAVLVCVLLGGGQYAAETEDASSRDDVPLFLFGGFDQWWSARWPAEGIGAALNRRKPEIVEALRSVALGSTEERRLFLDACGAITDPDKLREFRETFNDRQRSSLNDIMGRAHAIAARMDGSTAEEDVRKSHVPQQVFVR